MTYMFSQIDVPQKLITWHCSLARASFLWQMNLSCWVVCCVVI